MKIDPNINFKLEKLYLNNCGGLECSSWTIAPSSLLAILNAVASSDLQKSLDELHLNGCCVDERLLNKLVKECGISSIKILGSVKKKHFKPIQT
mmetsp:Transcript_18363/g.16235  ORF Transcript_18363/g.16235 Transcript_18363/m.16235 type:complete len:94 (+) Transcript_18363:525-806(+)